MTDGELRDPKQLVGLALACDGNADPNRLAAGLFVAESVNVITRALDAGYVPFAMLTDRRWLAGAEGLIARLREAAPNLPVVVASSEEVCAITGYRETRGPLAAFHRKPEPELADLLTGARRVAVLEDITNYTNIGAIFRSAAALGIDAVLLTPACHDPLFRRASRVSMGTVFQVPWARIGTARAWADEGVAQLHEAGFTIAALALSDDSIPLGDPAHPHGARRRLAERGRRQRRRLLGNPRAPLTLRVRRRKPHGRRHTRRDQHGRNAKYDKTQTCQPHGP